MRALAFTALLLATACGAPAPHLGPDAPRPNAAAPDLRPEREAPGDEVREGEALTIERVFASPSLSGPAPRGLRFSPDGSRISFLRPRQDDRTVLDLWAMDAADGRTYRLVDARALAPQERALSEAEIQFRERARISETGVVSYDWDSEGRAILVPLDGDLFHVDVETGEARRLTDTPEFETDARISPDGRHVSFIREQNLWVHDLETGQERALTTEGEGAVSWGVAEFVAQEEMRRMTGYWWSPDGARIAVVRLDETPVDIIPRFGVTADGVTVTDQRYPRAGRPNALVTLWVIDVATGARRPVYLGEETDIYLARVHWSRDSARIWIQRQNRAQTGLDILSADAASGRSRTILRERADTWINLSDDFITLEDGGFLWTSERSGFRHIYHVSADGQARALTGGDWMVTSLAGLSEDGETVYFEGWRETPLERHLYAVSFEGGEPQAITQGQGRWSTVMGRGGEAFIGTWSDPDTPPQVGLYAIDGSRIAWIEENALDEGHPYHPHIGAHVSPEFGTLTAADGQTELHWSMLRPDHCTAQNPCPVIVQVYGGPLVQTVHRGWTNPRDQLFAAHGYILFKLDNRGSSNRGHAFEAALHRRMGIVEAADQIAGLDYLQGLDFVDSDRIGLWGWSYGGYMALMTTLQAPGRFAAAVSGAPVTDWALYDTHYTERYMGTPQDNAEDYEAGSVFAHLDGYRTPTLIIHGMADDNVTFDNSTRLFAALQERGERFDMMTYPGERHGIRPPPLQVHLWRTIFGYFEREMPASADDAP
ncbi:prolyl oligopeptidase family serine peptidase [Alkalicaulis satelles]|uniref:Prolyl oligopeptidase family serine peptidase n=1 Tax=Alkalicaulis satelles TaxID=2609175 RepID=A0A5M6Z8J1_9PROT|nr:S9 family peptidase [Alkalicaulis satelles]KAA5800956.1 prolyl oligopeptidase family serine peptidase [Alkalicaulis satelles]